MLRPQVFSFFSKSVSQISRLQHPTRFLHCATTSCPDINSRIVNLRDAMLVANWSDYVIFLQDMTYWEAEYASLCYDLRLSQASPDTTNNFEKLTKLFDLVYIAQDVRDHLNEILEVKARSSGIAGTGLCASEPIENFDEHANATVAAYEDMLKRFPEYTTKIEEGVGSGLAAFRAKHKFYYHNMHKHFF